MFIFTFSHQNTLTGWMHVHPHKTHPKPVSWPCCLRSMLILAVSFLLPCLFCVFFSGCLTAIITPYACAYASRANKMLHGTTSDGGVIGGVSTLCMPRSPGHESKLTLFYLLPSWRILVSWGHPETTAALTVTPPAGSCPLLWHPPADLMTARGLNPLSAAGANWYWSCTVICL